MTPPAPPPPTSPTTPAKPLAPNIVRPAAASEGVRQPRRVPAWLQIVLIVGLFGAALFVALFERYLWSTLLAIAGTAFGLSFLLRQMVGDEYGRT